MKFIFRYIFILLSFCYALSSCSTISTGTKHTVISQTGNNRAFPSNKESKVKGRKYRANKSSMRSKQREHARYQGNEQISQ